MIDVIRADITPLDVDAMVWRGGNQNEDELLRSPYASSFELAVQELRIRSIAFPAISAGVHGFPRARAAGIAVAVMRSRESHVDRIVACPFDDELVRPYRARLAI